MNNRTTAPAPRQRCATSASRPAAAAFAAEPLEPRRHLSAGNLDPTFNGGQPLFVAPTHTGSFRTLATRPLANGQTLLAGTTSDETGSDTALVLERLNADGSLDATFGDNGRRGFSQINGEPFATFDAQNRLVVLDHLTLYRLTPDGQIDATFRGGSVPFRHIPALADFR